MARRNYQRIKMPWGATTSGSRRRETVPAHALPVTTGDAGDAGQAAVAICSIILRAA
jgi:hypothetical protein